MTERFWIGGATEWGGNPASGVRSLTVTSCKPAVLGPPAPVGPNPLFLAVVPDGGIVISHEVEKGSLTLVSDTDSLSSGLVPQLQTAPTESADPTNVAIVRFSSGAQAVLAANYSGGALSVNPIDGFALRDPSLVIRYTGGGPVTDRQASSHPHQVVVDYGSGLVLVPDLGTDQVHVHRIEDLENGIPDHRNIQLPPGSGPRHLVVSAGCALVAGELDALVHVVSIEGGHLVTSGSPSARGADSIQNFPSAIRLTRSGHVLVGNRGPDTIGVMTWEPVAESLDYVSEYECGGSHPRDFQLSSNEDFVVVANLQSDSVAILDFEDTEGVLSLRETLSTNSPACAVRERP